MHFRIKHNSRKRNLPPIFDSKEQTKQEKTRTKKTLLVELLSDSVVFILRDEERINNANGGRGAGDGAGIGAILHGLLSFQQQAHHAVHSLLVDYGGFHCNLFSVSEIESKSKK